jgi:hypothetical protein
MYWPSRLVARIGRLKTCCEDQVVETVTPTSVVTPTLVYSKHTPNAEPPTTSDCGQAQKAGLGLKLEGLVVSQVELPHALVCIVCVYMYMRV